MALPGRRHQPQDLDPAPRRPRDRGRVRPRRTPTRPVPAPPRDERRLARQHLRRRSLHRPPTPALHASLKRDKIAARRFRRLRHDHVSSEPGGWWIHRVAPFHASGEPFDLFRRLQAVVAAMPSTHIVTATDDYLHAVCRTRLGFRDDLEFRWCPSEGIAHVTSASRVGLFDFGVNRRRVDRVRRKLEAIRSGQASAAGYTS
ncbi:MAG: DUF1499 domain-containing protein [Gemmatimonadales bacterium]|nr:DUF1499 domain-containing protein [Gemmatimonadales bacterium]MYG20160.1 DUF1499 domain-containing protein [Gemmatimonadales bacterium]